MTVSSIAGTAWVRPTVRAIDWTALGLVTATLLVAEGILGWTGVEAPAIIRYAGVAALAAAAALGLGDPAQSLLQPVPTPSVVRLGHRTTLLLGTTASVAGLLVAVGHLVAMTPSGQHDLAAPLLALAATGIAVHAMAGPRIERRQEIAAVTILLWVAAAALPVPATLDALRLAWLEHSWWVVIVTVALTAGVTRRRSA